MNKTHNLDAFIIAHTFRIDSLYQVKGLFEREKNQHFLNIIIPIMNVLFGVG